MRINRFPVISQDHLPCVSYRLLLFEVHSRFYLSVTDFFLLASPQCVQGFLNEEAVRIAVDVYTSIRTHQRQQRIIPGINFTCNGTLTKWIIGAQQTLTQAPNYLQLQIWKRRGSSNTYDRVTFSDITALNATDDLNVYEYIPNPPLEFQANDFLGLYQPHIRDTQVTVYYQRGGGPRNFVRSSRDSPVTSNFKTGNGVDNDLPLVAVEVNGKMSFLLPHARKL